MVIPACACGTKATKKDASYSCENKMRAVFMRPCQLDIEQLKKGKKEAGAYLDGLVLELKQYGINAIFVGFRGDEDTDYACLGTPSGSLFYDSETYDGMEDPTFHSLFKKGIDPVKMLLEKAKANKIEVHSWSPVFRDAALVEFERIKGNSVKYQSFKESWHWPWEEPKECKVGDVYLDPGDSDVQTKELDILKDIVKQNPTLTGLNLDYVRYYSPPNCERIGSMDAQNVVNFVKKVREEFPNITLSADVFSGVISPALLVVGQDIGGIAQHVDMLMPMAYSAMSCRASNFVFGVTRDFRQKWPNVKLVPIIEAWYTNESECAQGGCNGASLKYPANYQEKMCTEMKYVDDASANGVAFFDYPFECSPEGRNWHKLRDRVASDCSTGEGNKSNKISWKGGGLPELSKTCCSGSPSPLADYDQTLLALLWQYYLKAWGEARFAERSGDLLAMKRMIGSACNCGALLMYKKEIKELALLRGKCEETEGVLGQALAGASSFWNDVDINPRSYEEEMRALEAEKKEAERTLKTVSLLSGGPMSAIDRSQAYVTLEGYYPKGIDITLKHARRNLDPELVKKAAKFAPLLKTLQGRHSAWLNIAETLCYIIEAKEQKGQ